MGRWKTGPGGPYYDQNDSGPDQVSPPPQMGTAGPMPAPQPQAQPPSAIGGFNIDPRTGLSSNTGFSGGPAVLPSGGSMSFDPSQLKPPMDPSVAPIGQMEGNLGTMSQMENPAPAGGMMTPPAALPPSVHDLLQQAVQSHGHSAVADALHQILQRNSGGGSLSSLARLGRGTFGGGFF